MGLNHEDQYIRNDNFLLISSTELKRLIHCLVFKRSNVYHTLCIDRKATALLMYLTWTGVPWGSLIEGDEQMDQAKNQTSVECCNVHMLHIFWFCHKHNGLLLVPIQPSSPSTKELHGRSHGLVRSRKTTRLANTKNLIDKIKFFRFVSRQFVRKYTLPDGCKPEQVSSNLSSDGVLLITAPKKPPQPAITDHGRNVPILMK